MGEKLKSELSKSFQMRFITQLLQLRKNPITKEEGSTIVAATSILGALSLGFLISAHYYNGINALIYRQNAIDSVSDFMTTLNSYLSNQSLCSADTTNANGAAFGGLPFPSPTSSAPSNTNSPFPADVIPSSLIQERPNIQIGSMRLAPSYPLPNSSLTIQSIKWLAPQKADGTLTPSGSGSTVLALNGRAGNPASAQQILLTSYHVPFQITVTSRPNAAIPAFSVSKTIQMIIGVDPNSQKIVSCQALGNTDPNFNEIYCNKNGGSNTGVLQTRCQMNPSLICTNLGGVWNSTTKTCREQ